MTLGSAPLVGLALGVVVKKTTLAGADDCVTPVPVVAEDAVVEEVDRDVVLLVGGRVRAVRLLQTVLYPESPNVAVSLVLENEIETLTLNQRLQSIGKAR